MLRPVMLLAPTLLIALLAACAPSPTTPAARQRQMFGLVEKFDRYDENGDGYLNRSELTRGVNNAGGSIQLTKAKARKVIKAYDLNGDRRISQTEAQKGADLGPEIFDDEGG